MLKREQILDKQNSLVDENKALWNKIQEAKYAVNRKLEQFGFINQLESLGECISALAFIKNQSIVGAEAAKELGLEVAVDNTFLGYSIKDWSDDVKTRAEQIKNILQYQKNEQAIHVLETHLSPDDKFTRDMIELESLLSDDSALKESINN